MLSPFSRLYGAITRTRISLYQKGLLKSRPLGAPTISVGNITVGGTGKTPLVAFVARELAEGGERVCILTRGYGRRQPNRRILVSDGNRILVGDAALAGDEPVELAGKLLGTALVIADADRVAAARWVREKYGVTVFVLDDAFQHLRAKRDLDIVAVDATDPFGNGRLLPAGTLREPPEHLKRAGAVVITRANLIDDPGPLAAGIARYSPRCPVFISRNKIAGFIPLEDFHAENEELPAAGTTAVELPPAAGRCFLAFCALGNPENFFEQLRREGFDSLVTVKFPDHHFYRQKDIEKLEKKARRAGADIFLTTPKDAVKLKELDFGLPCLVVENELILDDQPGFRKLIGAVV